MSLSETIRIGAPLSGEPHPVLQWIEVASFLQIPSFHVIGLPAPEVAESRERVRAAIDASGFEFPRRRVVVNLSPASIRKRGTGIDLAVGLAILVDSEGLRCKGGHRAVVAWGELGLDGTIQPVGQLARAIYAAWESAASLLVVSRSELAAAMERLEWIREGASLLGPPPTVIGAGSLAEAWEALEAHVRGKMPERFLLPPVSQTAAIVPFSNPSPSSAPSPSSTRSDDRMLLSLPASLERLLGVAVSGAHHLLLLGPRGAGKSHALEWFSALQPPLSPHTRVRHALLEDLGSSGGQALGRSGTSGGFEVPIRKVSVHARAAALVGSASASGVRPGEFSLAHGGVLLADELPEWSRDCREALREPLEKGTVTLTRIHRSAELPARFLLAATGNLCPCGGWPRDLPLPGHASKAKDSSGEKAQRCRCTQGARRSYLARLSGPILDRIDIVALTSASPGAQGTQCAPSKERLTQIRARVAATRERAVSLWGDPPGWLSATALEKLLGHHPDWDGFLRSGRIASLRSRHKTIRLALSLAAWDDLPTPSAAHFSEASLYRAERAGFGG